MITDQGALVRAVLDGHHEAALVLADLWDERGDERGRRLRRRARYYALLDQIWRRSRERVVFPGVPRASRESVSWWCRKRKASRVEFRGYVLRLANTRPGDRIVRKDEPSVPLWLNGV